MREYTDGEIIVGFSADIPSTEAEKAIVNFGFSAKNKMGSRNTYRVEVPVGSEQRWIDDFKKLTSVRFAERNGIIRLPKPWEPQ